MTIDNAGGYSNWQWGKPAQPTGMMDEMSLIMMPGRPKGAVFCNGLLPEFHTPLDSWTGSRSSQCNWCVDIEWFFQVGVIQIFYKDYDEDAKYIIFTNEVGMDTSTNLLSWGNQIWKRYTLDGYSSLRARYLVSYPAERMTWIGTFHQGQISQNPPTAIFWHLGPEISNTSN